MLKINKIMLKINKILFRWYYKKCGDFFAKWKFKKSVKLLIQNYEHTQLLYRNECSYTKNLIKENSKLRKEIFQFKMQQTASENQIDILNNSFGLDIKKPSEN